MDKLEKIVLIDLDSELPNLGKLLAMPRFGITVIGSVLSNAGYDVSVLSEAYTEVSLEEVLEKNPDYVMFNGIKPSMDKVRKMASQIKQKTDIPIIIGGEEATVSPENVQDFADFIVLYEGDKTILELIENLKFKKDISKIKGIKYKDSGNWVTTEKPERIKKIEYHITPEIFIGLKDFGRKSLARLFNITPDLKAIRFPIQTSRGCRFSCSFCSKDALFGGKGYFERPIEDIIQDIDRIMEYSGITKFSIVDNMFGDSKEYMMEFFKMAIARYKDKVKPGFSALMRANQFNENCLSNEDLSLMKKAGFEHITLGMESVNKKSLEQYNKNGGIEVYVNIIKKLAGQGIEAVLTFAVGGGYDTKEDIKAIVKFAKKYNVRQINFYAFSITPGTKEYEENGHQVIPGIADKYWNGHAVRIFPRNMLPSELQEEMIGSMKEFYSTASPIHWAYRRMINRIVESLAPHLDFLKNLETELIKERIYRKKGSSWQLDKTKLKEKYFQSEHV